MLCANDTPLFDLTSNSTRRFIAALELFQKGYSPVHGFICVAICTFGIITNLVHILVLTRPTMRCSAVNCVLTAVAICDMGTMGSYLVYICHFVLFKDLSCFPIYTHFWMLFLICHMVLSIALHTTSLWLVVAMAFIRRMTLKSAVLNSDWQQPQFAWRVCIVVYILVFLLCIPTMFVHEIVEFADWHPSDQCVHRYPSNFTIKLYTFDISKSATSNGCRFFKLNLWMSGLLFKVIPCILLLDFSIALVCKLHRTAKKRKALLKKSSLAAKRQPQKTERTTGLLLAILMVFLIAELPQGILAILNAIFTTHVHMYIYYHLGDILDLLSLLNSSINFVLYCVMSSRYRNTFWTVVLPQKFYRKLFTDRTYGPFSLRGVTTNALSCQPNECVAASNNNDCRLMSDMEDFSGCDDDDALDEVSYHEYSAMSTFSEDVHL